MKIPENQTIQELFDWRFKRTPNAVAHKFLDRETTYEELNIYSNQIANGSSWMLAGTRLCQFNALVIYRVSQNSNKSRIGRKHDRQANPRDRYNLHDP